MLWSSSDERCAQQEYRELFACSAEELHWLCYTLTGDEELSERALAVGLEQTMEGADRVFREWMASWARRLMIKFCIAVVRPEASITRSLRALPLIALDSVSTNQLEIILSLPAELLQQKLLRLDALSRFVFVLRALEGYSCRDTALLLNLDDRTCDWVYSNVVKTIRPNVYAMKEVGTAMKLVTKSYRVCSQAKKSA